MTDQQQPPDPPRDPMAVSATSAMLGLQQPSTTPDGKIVLPVDSLAVGKR